MYLHPDLPSYFCCAALQYLIPATLLIATSKHSALRYLSIPCMIWIVSRFVRPVDSASPTRCNAVAVLVVSAVQAVNLLLINPMDDDAFCREKPRRSLFLTDRFYAAFEALSQTRGFNTPRQVKTVPAHPKYYTCRGDDIPRARFLLRQSAIAIWQYLVCDIFQHLARQRALEQDPQAGFSHIEWVLPVEAWIERVITNLVTGIVLSRILIDAHYRIMSIVFVGLGLDSPSNWPPAFGRMADSYTIRDFYGRVPIFPVSRLDPLSANILNRKFWHQFLRQPFTAVSNFISRKLLHLPRLSILERYTNNFLVALLSALLHTLVDTVQGTPLDYSGSLAFFLSMILGMMIEDGVRALWNRVQPPSDTKQSSGEASLPAWRRAVGLVWVMGWLGVTSTFYFHPISQLPAGETTLVPLSLVEIIGFETVGVVVAISGPVIGFAFAVEM